MRFAAPLSGSARARVAIPFAVVTLIWGSTWIVIRAQLGSVPSAWSVAYRFLIASGTMFAVAAVRRLPLRLGARDQLFLAAMGVAIFTCNFNLVYRAEAYVASGLVAVTFALLIVYNSVLGRLVLKQPISRPFLAGSAVAMLGVALLFAHELAAATHGRQALAAGVGLTLVAMGFASIANVMQGTRRAQAIAMPTLLAWSSLWGALADGAWAWASAGPPRFDPAPGYVAGLLYLGVIASALAFTLYFGVIRAIGPARGGYVNVLTPFIAMALSTLFEGYRWSLPALVGCALAVGGLVVAIRARSPAR